MKQSNIILGIGIIVAVILIAGSLFLKAGPAEQQKSANQIEPITTVRKSAKKITLEPFEIISRHILKIRL